PSAFRNRITANLIGNTDFSIRNESTETKMIVVADADIIRNDVRRVGTTETPYALGQDRYTGEVLFGNRDFIINCLNYLVDDNNIMELRSREIKLRLLDKTRIRNEKTKWQVINITGPVILVVLAGILYGWTRKRVYTKY
ncbi:MAG: gliding motility-associated ABC transporter permease subunit GldF, partial [Bacteroidales bacterium]|nr:gliding motility-associated ABC transporter permease subunit GldF [Bacteroidales bacterium]